jgi:putative transcriptional regulator
LRGSIAKKEHPTYPHLLALNIFDNIGVKQLGVFPLKLSEARNNKNIVQEDLAHMIDVSLRYYQRLESGKSIHTIKIALRICKILEVSPFDIDEWQDDLTK